MASIELRAAAQQALEALEAMTKHFGFARLGSSSLADTMKRGAAHVAMNNLRAALAEPVQEPDSPERRCGGPGCDGTCCQPVQEPFGYLWPTGRHPEFRFTQQKRDGVDGMPLYTASPQRKPLSEDEIFKIENDIPDDVIGDRAWTIWFARAVERAHGIKPTGCDHCNHPLYAAVKCKVCGRVTEPVQEPVLGIGGKE